MGVMKPVSSEAVPYGEGWVYEVKYDGFRCVLDWDKENVRLTSKNNKDLTNNFPEIIAFFQEQQELINDLLPLQLDGELVILNHQYQANFSLVQKRGRLKNKTSIEKAAQLRPASFQAFDLLQQKGKDYRSNPYHERKETLRLFLKKMKTEKTSQQPIAMIETHDNADALQEIVFNHKGEGIIAKRKSSTYREGKSHQDWFKIKNWRTIYGFLTHFNTKNGYFTVHVYDDAKMIEVGKCKHGLTRETAGTLKELFFSKGEKQGETYTLPPAICAAVKTLDFYKNELREPEFSKLLPEASPQDFTIQKLKIDMAMLPKIIEPTNTDKFFWPSCHLTKGDLLVYLREIAPYMLPFLKERALTIIRSPDGVTKEHFFQKHLPSHAPSFIEGVPIDDEQFIVCNQLDALIWFANHGAIEYHVPFQLIQSTSPAEIVFDLDPPGRERFDLAVQAALLIKQLLDDLDLISFVKTSGNKGLQIHIPIAEGSMTYEETATFTQAIAFTLEQAYPDLFTTERFKNKRNGRLYIDYVQHGKDKTLIAPYSPRKTMDATVATPLFWEEVKEGLTPDQFTIENVVERVQTYSCPFTDYFVAGGRQKLDKILERLR